VCTIFFNVKCSRILPTECIYIFRMIIKLKSYYFLNTINWLVFAMGRQCVDCEVGNKCLYITLIKFIFQVYNLYTAFWSECQMLTKT